MHIQETPVMIIGVPMDLGAGRRGVDMGPSAIRYAHLDQVLIDMGLEVDDQGNLEVPIPESAPKKGSSVRFEAEIHKVCVTLAKRVARALERGYFPVILGGDHSMAMGSIVGVARVKKPLGLLWFDAHGDFNVPKTSPSGNIHGMPLSAVMGYGSKTLVKFCKDVNISPRNVALVGIRDVDPEERTLLLESGIRTYTMESVDRMGLDGVMERALKDVTHGTRGFHFSFDVDVLDPADAPGVGTPALGGITYRESLMAMEMAAETGKITSLDIAEVNPIMDVKNQTARIAVSLIASALGKRII